MHLFYSKEGNQGVSMCKIGLRREKGREKRRSGPMETDRKDPLSTTFFLFLVLGLFLRLSSFFLTNRLPSRLLLRLDDLFHARTREKGQGREK